MKLPAVPVTSFQDATLNAEALQQFLASGQIAVGSVTFTFAASATSGTQTVNHGLGRTPRVWLQNASGATGISSVVTAASSTSFTAEAFTTAGGAITGSFQYWWLAIG